MDSIILAIVLCQIHMQVVEYTLDDQPIIFNKCEEVLLIFSNYRSFKKVASG